MKDRMTIFLLISLGVIVVCLFLILLPTGKETNPIVLVHGFGGNGRIWDDKYRVVPFFENELRLKFGGILTLDETGNVEIDRQVEKPDFFAVTFTDNFASIRTQAIELDKFLAHVRRITGAQRVVIVAFSMGGLTARQYLVNHVTDHQVKKFISIGTPHLGSELALVYDLYQWSLHNQNRDDFSQNNLDNLFKFFDKEIAGILVPILSSIEELAEATFFKNKHNTLSAPALADLRPLRNNDYASYLDGFTPGRTLLDSIGYAPHPRNVQYCCIIGDIKADTLKAEDDQTSILNELAGDDESVQFERWIYKLGNFILNLLTNHRGSNNFLHGGDGAVTIYSQNLNHVPFFQRQKIKVRTYQINDVGHLEECWHHKIIKQALGY